MWKFYAAQLRSLPLATFLSSFFSPKGVAGEIKTGVAYTVLFWHRHLCIFVIMYTSRKGLGEIFELFVFRIFTARLTHLCFTPSTVHMLPLLIKLEEKP